MDYDVEMHAMGGPEDKAIIHTCMCSARWGYLYYYNDVYPVFQYSMQAICLAEILSGSEDHEEMMEHSSNPHLSNFYLIKFGASSQLIIPKWEGGIKRVFSQSEDFSEEEDEV